MAFEGEHFGRLLEPGLKEVFYGEYRLVPEQYQQIFKVLTSDRWGEREKRYAGLGLWDGKGYMEPTHYQDGLEGPEILYVHETWSSGFQVVKEDYDDRQLGDVDEKSRSLARGGRLTVETNAMQVLNKGFGGYYTDAKGKSRPATIYDGQPLFSENHPRLDGGASISNKMDGRLSETNLKIAIKLAGEQVDDRGNKIVCKPKKLYVPSALEFEALEIVKSVNSTEASGGFAKNNINVLRDRLQVEVLDHLDNDDAWFLSDPTLNKLKFYWREKVSFKNERDFDTDVAKYKGRMRFSWGVSDFRGWVGSTGTGS